MTFSSIYIWLASAALYVPNIASTTNSRRILRPKDNVSEMIKRSHDPRSGGGRHKVMMDRYTIHTEIETGSENAETEQLAMDVVEAINPAVTSETMIKDQRGNEFILGESDVLLHTLLVTDVETSDGADSFAMLAINPENDDMHGIVEKRGRHGGRVPYKIKQSRDEHEGMAVAEEEVNLLMPDWHCDVGQAEELPGDEEDIERRLVEDHFHHEPHHHDATEQHQDQENLSSIESLFKSVRGVKPNPLNKSRLLQSASYNFQVDMFIEIDNAFVSNLGGLNNAINYVNTLVTGANVVYEKEIDTHLRVTNIVVSNLYDGATSTSNALSIMRSHYAGDDWHSPNVDIHHALLGGIGGGIAYIGVLCRSKWGFGLTGGIKGNFVSMDQPVIWDMKSFMHEIGHNFGSGHTHDAKYYDPVIDRCGISCPAAAGYGWSTIMSYCQWCPGSYGNIMYTFGADYDGSGDVTNLSNWPVNPNLVANYDSTHLSVRPNREARRMYLHIKNKGESGCVDLSPPAPVVQHAPVPNPVSDFSIASYDEDLGIPKCSKVGSFCDSGNLLISRHEIEGVSEPNSSNTIHSSCTDGAAGYYHSDESVDSIRVSSFSGGNMRTGGKVRIVAKIWAFNPSSDFVDFFHTNDATNPQWELIETISPDSNGANDITTQCTLGNGSLQAVRVIIRYNGAAVPCPEGMYDDADDLAFEVKPSATGPVSIPSPNQEPMPLTSKPSRPPTAKPSRPPTDKPSHLPTAKPTRMPIFKLTPIPTPSPKSGK